MNTPESELEALKNDYRAIVAEVEALKLAIVVAKSERDRAVKSRDQFRWSDIWVPGLVVGATIAACKLYGEFR